MTTIDSATIAHHDVRLAELLCTRLCHDLTGPIGAVNNGAEFLREEAFSLQEQAVDLIVNSAQQAVNRLQFYRQAYGRINYDGEASLNEVRKLAEEFFRDSRYKLHWPHLFTDSAQLSVSRKMAKLILNTLIILTTGLPRGGDVHLALEQPEAGGIQVRLHGEGTGVRVDEATLAAFLMQAHIDEVTPKTVQPYFTAWLANSLGVSLKHEVTETSFAITAYHP